MMEFLNAPGLPRAPSAAASGIKVALREVILISGQVAWDEEGNVVGPGDIDAQAMQAFRNLRDVLALGGADLTDIVKLNFYLTSQSYRQPVLRVREQWLGEHHPPSTTVIVRGLVEPELMIEIDAIAVPASGT